MQPRADQRRLAERYPQALDVEINLKSGGKLAKTVDVSRHGLFVRMSKPPPENHIVLLTVHLPNGPFETMATVAWREERGKQQGAGVKLYCLASEAKERWDTFIQSVSGKEFSLTPRPSVAADSASFIVQLETADEIERFVNRHVRTRDIVHVTPALKKIGAEILCVLVHPETHKEFLVTAEVEELYDDKPHRMGVRFAPWDEAQKRRFRTFLGIDERSKPPTPNEQEAEWQQEFVPSKRRTFTEYAFFSPKVKTPAEEAAEAAAAAAAAEAPAEESAELEVVQGSSLDMPELELVDKSRLFDFNWNAEDNE